MRGLFLTHPGFGHFEPMVPLARAFQAEGDDVSFASSADFRRHIEGAGFEAHAAGLDWLEFRADETFPELRRLPLEELELWFLQEVFAGNAAERMCASLLQLCDRLKPDFLVCNEFELSTHVAAELTGTPFATLGLGVYVPGRALSSVVGAAIAHLRDLHGLGPDPELSRLHGDLYLSWFPRSYHFVDTPLPAAFHALRAPAIATVADDEPDWLGDLGRLPTVLATLGTVFNRTPEAAEAFEAIIDALEDEPVNLIVTTGPGQDGAALRRSSRRARVLEYVPHAALVPHCDVVMTQGGSATTRLALAHGVPLLIVPLNGEDVFHAMRCTDLGLGRVVKHPHLFEGYLRSGSYGDLSTAEMRTTIRRLLDEPSYRDNARRIAAEMEALPGPEQAVAAMRAICASQPALR